MKGKPLLTFHFDMSTAHLKTPCGCSAIASRERAEGGDKYEGIASLLASLLRMGMRIRVHDLDGGKKGDVHLDASTSVEETIRNAESALGLEESTKKIFFRGRALNQSEQPLDARGVTDGSILLLQRERKRSREGESAGTLEQGDPRKSKRKELGQNFAAPTRGEVHESGQQLGQRVWEELEWERKNSLASSESVEYKNASIPFPSAKGASSSDNGPQKRAMGKSGGDNDHSSACERSEDEPKRSASGKRFVSAKARKAERLPLPRCLEDVVEKFSHVIVNYMFCQKHNSFLLSSSLAPTVNEHDLKVRPSMRECLLDFFFWFPSKKKKIKNREEE